MNSLTRKNRESFSGIGPALLTALLIILFLFFIDEGYYNFNWMKEVGNWIVFFIYFIFTFTLMWIVTHFLFGKLNGLARWVSAMGAGFAITLVAVFTLFK